MIKLIRTDSRNKEFIGLVKLLDAELAIRDGDEHGFYAQYNKIDTLKQVVVAFIKEIPVGCGAIKHYDDSIMEVKRMYTAPQSRGKGVASAILSELEKWTAELGYKHCILETGIRQPEAIGLYSKYGYKLIPNYGQYADVADSRCFQKTIR